MAAWKLGPALAAGNSVILKPAEQSPYTALRIASLAIEAGLPEGVLNVLSGYGEAAGQALGRHMDVDCVTFTGSTEIGKLFMKYAGESNAKRVSLELGGKSPQVVLADCDLDAAAAGVAAGIFANAGQVCNAGSRLVVEASIKDALLERLVKHAEALKIGDPFEPSTKLGPLVSKEQHERVLSYIESGRKQGASVATGGAKALDGSGGYFVQPTIFDGVRNDMKIAQEEIFGPVLSIISYTDEDDAIRIANESDYGLGGSVWTPDLERARRVARRVRTGTVGINGYLPDPAGPWGGVKSSGLGRELGPGAIAAYQNLKTLYA
jgi:gamma-glutamyl-gamma-aminobutyraldehyde dehydrogenase